MSEAKPVIRGELIEAGEAIVYSEPERPVTSRSGDDCVVALTDQWYMTYGEADWEAATRCALSISTLPCEVCNDDACMVIIIVHELTWPSGRLPQTCPTWAHPSWYTFAETRTVCRAQHQWYIIYCKAAPGTGLPLGTHYACL